MSPSTLRSADAGQSPIDGALRVGVLAECAPPDPRLLAALERQGRGMVVVALSKPVGDPAVEAIALDVVVIVTESAGEAGGGPLATLLAPFAQVPAVIVASSLDRVSIQGALRLGVCGFVLADDVERCAVPTLLAVSVGQTVLPGGDRSGLHRPLLSAREKQVLSMVVLGFTNLDVANRLYIAETTVKSHLSSAYRKLGVRSRQEATALILSDSGLGLGILTFAGGEDRRAEGRAR